MYIPRSSQYVWSSSKHEIPGAIAEEQTIYMAKAIDAAKTTRYILISCQKEHGHDERHQRKDRTDSQRSLPVWTVSLQSCEIREALVEVPTTRRQSFTLTPWCLPHKSFQRNVLRRVCRQRRGRELLMSWMPARYPGLFDGSRWRFRWR